MTDTDILKYSTSDLYERYVVPLLFEPLDRVAEAGLKEGDLT
jgi:hypothetical protein